MSIANVVPALALALLGQVDEGKVFDPDPDAYIAVITPYHRNYFTVDADLEESKFQISLKARLFPRDWSIGTARFFLGYTQTSFWLLQERSQPFRESNYGADLFLRWPETDRPGWQLGTGQIGCEHQSNGRAGQDSRSWDRFYVEQSVVYQSITGLLSFRVGLRLWEVYATELNNEDIEDFYGPGQLNLDLRVGLLQLAVAVRVGRDTDNRTFRVEGAIRPKPDFGFALYGHYWNGYGESLIDYNVKEESFRAGLLFGW